MGAFFGSVFQASVRHCAHWSFVASVATTASLGETMIMPLVMCCIVSIAAGEGRSSSFVWLSVRRFWLPTVMENGCSCCWRYVEIACCCSMLPMWSVKCSLIVEYGCSVVLPRLGRGRSTLTRPGSCMSLVMV